MKRVAVLLLVATACSSGTAKHSPVAAPSVTATPSATVTALATGAPPSPLPTAVALDGPVGTTVPQGFHPSSATFISDRTGWVLGASPCPSGAGDCDVIARTRDGGATWRAIPSPATSPDHLAQIRFADPRNGFVTGDQLWATHDGGATWKVVPGSNDVTALAAAAGRVWVLRESALRSAPVAGGAFRAEQGEAFGGFALRGATVVFHPDGRQRALVTVTPGTSGRELDDPCSEGDSSIIGLGMSHWLLVCEGDAGLGHQGKKAYRSEDRGHTWQPSGDPPPLTGTDIYVTSDGDFVIDHQEVAVYRGGMWKVALGSDGGLSEGVFESAVLGFAIGGFDGSADAVMKITHDAGRTWRTVAF